MRRLQKVLVFHYFNPGLSVFCIQVLEFGDGKFFYRIANHLRQQHPNFLNLYYVEIIKEIWTMSWQADHIERGCSFKRSMNMIIFSFLGLIHVGGHPAILVRLSG